ncbi:methionine aminopeptidase 1c, putative (METAP1c) [Plasmodium ovale wallikeri]|uniref:Methionine aminopeptidase 1c, putative (METAP1c) n=1 Tax=Plasmodium ovale wallikeri TaxID=864142 RepID=A0A1A8YHK2_PLAOA|nr:methionine aminopeptidase 1c, putative (METAP1c) [Plasmodium ovale wallikeri]SBT31025.1 methionine aminopeptidase 1c, putative (METAP1c) [Plasmodium ovale wallikeri]
MVKNEDYRGGSYRGGGYRGGGYRGGGYRSSFNRGRGKWAVLTRKGKTVSGQCYRFIITKRGNGGVKRNRLNSAGEGFANTFHHDIKKNTKDYTEDKLPSYHRYIENFKTRKIIHPSIRITDHDKRFIKCKDSYNKLYSHLGDTELFSNFSYVGRQRKGVLSPKYYLPKYIERPNYHRTGTPVYVNYNTETSSNGESNYDEYSNSSHDQYNNVKTDADIEVIARNCSFVRELMDDVSYIVCEGITTNDIDVYVLNKCVNNGYYPSPLNYYFFPKSTCISINEILCHGIPDNNVLFENDIVKVDISVYKDGYHADMCESFLVPNLSKTQKKKRKRNYDFIYLNNKFRTKHTKHILKYHFDLTKNMIVKKGKHPTARKLSYVAPNSKGQNTEHHYGYDDNANAVPMWLGKDEEKSITHDIVEDNTMSDSSSNGSISRSSNTYADSQIGEGGIYLENFHRQYDEEVIFNPQKGQMYRDIQQYLYNKEMEAEGNSRRDRHFPFFERSRLSVNDFKRYMYEKNLKLIKTAYECTMEAISVCKHGVPFKAIGDAMDSYLKRINNAYEYYSIVPNLCGHHIGKNFHEEPYIIHTVNDDERTMCENNVFTIEPIVSERSCDFITWPDNWTLSNSRYYFSAQFEHTILIKKHGAEVLTRKMETSPKYVWQQDAL